MIDGDVQTLNTSCKDLEEERHCSNGKLSHDDKMSGVCFWEQGLETMRVAG
jgi:hypothetical protein